MNLETQVGLAVESLLFFSVSNQFRRISAF